MVVLSFHAPKCCLQSVSKPNICLFSINICTHSKTVFPFPQIFAFTFLTLLCFYISRRTKLHFLRGVNASLSWRDKVWCWSFPTGAKIRWREMLLNPLSYAAFSLFLYPVILPPLFFSIFSPYQLIVQRWVTTIELDSYFWISFWGTIKNAPFDI